MEIEFLDCNVLGIDEELRSIFCQASNKAALLNCFLNSSFTSGLKVFQIIFSYLILVFIESDFGAYFFTENESKGYRSLKKWVQNSMTYLIELNGIIETLEHRAQIFQLFKKVGVKLNHIFL